MTSLGVAGPLLPALCCMTVSVSCLLQMQVQLEA